MNPQIPTEDPIDRERFPAEPWRWVETHYESGDMGATEATFSVGNGYLGMRANPEEGRPAAEHGTFINGFHETWPIRHAEQAYGFAKTGQTIVNVPDAKLIKVYVDDEPLLLSMADLQAYERSLDFRDGILRRDLIWQTPAGKRVRVRSTRMTSFTDRHLALMTFEVTMLDDEAPVVISSQIVNRQSGRDEYNLAASESADPRKAGRLQDVLEPMQHWNSERRMILGYRCRNSHMTLAVAADHTVSSESTVEELISTEPDIGKKVFRVEAEPGKPIRITKAVAYHTSRSVPVRELFDRCRRTLDRVRDNGFEHYERGQRAWLDKFWDTTDVKIGGQPELQQAVRWSMFQLAQAAGRADQFGIAAKGVTGSGYEGHYFWDTDIYVVPALIYTNPALARNALRFRVNIVDAARRRARELNQRGILFPWRTINGEEASAYYAAGTAQYHIDADVAFAFAKYADSSGDRGFLYREGAEVLAETARMWADLGFWREADQGQEFHIHGVTGPDEYTTVVNNNLFTNVMAKYNLSRAASLLREMQVEAQADYERLAKKIELDPAEIDEWEACAAGMMIPFDDHVGIHPQSEDFLERELWDLASTPDEYRPLLLHFHPLVIYRYQVLKQADTILALFLQGNQFTPEQIKADFDYYDPITTGDSSLSAVVQSIMAAYIGYKKLALDYFNGGLFVDLADLHHNTSDGLHIASIGGVWNALVYGFAGMRDYQGDITFDPRLPRDWTELEFSLIVRDTTIRVRLAQTAMTFRAEGMDGVEVGVRGQRYELEPGIEVVVPLAGQGPNVRVPRAATKGALRSDGSVITSNTPSMTSWDTSAVDSDDLPNRVPDDQQKGSL
ncbi:glycoside hydrolase family 65 protein [Nigerium massiliense]|uniref:glycoside hydrolase family 65 protein n=1 Tax=Nigerium massiliense TaxID=1522317 RepID=UPI000907C99F|nr:glycosyl hydrolase family 65 protein [Nigerium massiliense]